MQGIIGTTIQHYHVERHLAKGGMSEVYVAKDLRTQQEVALKIVRNNIGDYSERFRREIKAVARLKHEHILPALDSGQFSHWSFLVMPYLTQGTLRDRLEQGPLSLNEIDILLRQIADALQFAHEHDILHRDIKASNVLLLDNEYAYLADFGLVKSAEDEISLTRTGYLVGTPEYMAPELVDIHATAQSDIYALGVVLFQMLTADLPFKGHTPVSIVMKHLQEKPQLPSALNPLVPVSVDQVVMRALEKDPEKRYQSARELAEAYHQALVTEGTRETLEAPVALSTHQSQKTIDKQTSDLMTPDALEFPAIHPADKEASDYKTVSLHSASLADLKTVASVPATVFDAQTIIAPAVPVTPGLHNEVDLEEPTVIVSHPVAEVEHNVSSQTKESQPIFPPLPPSQIRIKPLSPMPEVVPNPTSRPSLTKISNWIKHQSRTTLLLLAVGLICLVILLFLAIVSLFPSYQSIKPVPHQNIVTATSIHKAPTSKPTQVNQKKQKQHK